VRGPVYGPPLTYIHTTLDTIRDDQEQGCALQCSIHNYKWYSSVLIKLHNENNKMQISGSLPYSILRNTAEIFIGNMEKSIYDLMQTMFYCELIWQPELPKFWWTCLM
jgi:hypothetical protein